MQSSRQDVAVLDCLLIINHLKNPRYPPEALGQRDVGHSGVANRTAKGSICRISAFFAEIKALSRRGDFSLSSHIQMVFAGLS